MHSNSNLSVMTFPSSAMTLGDALRIAMEFERSASHLYRDLAGKMDPEARRLALELAAEGKAHFKSLQSLADSIHLGEEMKYPIAIPHAAEAFRNYTNLPDLPDDPTEDDVLDYAERRQRIACDYYGSLARSVPSAAIQELFFRFRDEGIRHEAEIRSCWATLFLVY